MGRSPCCAKVGLNRGAWTALEDKILADYIQVHGEGRWKQLPNNAGLQRCGKSCRLRWLNYLRPDIKRGNISEDEEELIVRLHKLLGNRWSLIAGRLPGRTDNEIKNYWNTNLSKKAASSSSSASQVITSPITKPNTATNNASSQVFRTRATRCSKVVVQSQLPLPPPPPPPTDIIVSYDQNGAFVGHSLFHSDNDLGGIMPAFTNFLDDDLGLGDFCLSDFLNMDHQDQFLNQSIINADNIQNDHDFSESLNWDLDGHDYQDRSKLSSTNMEDTGT